MKKLLFSSFVFCILSGCGIKVIDYHESPLPGDYVGGTALLHDTTERIGRRQGWVYNVKSVNGVYVENAARRSVTATKEESSYNYLTLVSESREIPEGSVRVSLEARLVSSQSSSSGRLLQEETLSFSPKAGEQYWVQAEVTGKGASLWIESIDGEPVTEIVGTPLRYDTRKGVFGSTGKARHGQFFRIPGSETADRVIERLGQPDKTVSRDRDRLPSNLEAISFIYRDLGRVEFSVYQGKPYMHKVVPSQDFDKSGAIIEHMLGSPLETQRLMAARLFEAEDEIGQDSMDDLAVYVWENRDTNHIQVADAMAWLCKVLGSRGGGRYNNFLSGLAETTSSGKIKRHANDWVMGYVQPGVVQFDVEKYIRENSIPG